MKTQAAVWVPFGDLMHHETSHTDPIFQRGPGTPAWWERRAEVFQKFTLKSLANQNHKDFILLAGIAQETKDLAEPVLKVLRDFGSRAVPIFHPATATVNRGQSAVQSAILQTLDVADASLIFHLDSDDMYARDAIQCGMKIPPIEGQVLLFRQGYIWDTNGHKMYFHEPKGAPPPFFARTYMSWAKDGLSKYEEKYNLLVYHHQLMRSPIFRNLPDGKYCVTVHDQNTSTTMTNQHTISKLGVPLDMKHQQRVEVEFGL